MGRPEATRSQSPYRFFSLAPIRNTTNSPSDFAVIRRLFTLICETPVIVANRSDVEAPIHLPMTLAEEQEEPLIVRRAPLRQRNTSVPKVSW
jgi:hypothetical protein